MQPPIAWIEGLFAIGFLLISFIGWIVNLINAQNPPPAPNRGPQRRPQARDRKVQSEIEEFLQEAMGNKRRGRADQNRPEDLETLEPAPDPQRRPARQTKRRPPARTSVSSESASTPRQRSKPGQEASSRHVVPSDQLGRSVSSHLQAHMNQRVSQETELHLPHMVDQSVAQHLGAFTADDHDTRSTVQPLIRSRANIPNPSGLISEIQNPAGMRKAIVLQEILARPRALRR